MDSTAGSIIAVAAVVLVVGIALVVSARLTAARRTGPTPTASRCRSTTISLIRPRGPAAVASGS